LFVFWVSLAGNHFSRIQDGILLKNKNNRLSTSTLNEYLQFEPNIDPYLISIGQDLEGKIV
jgi:hypothetical protein